MAGPPRSQRDPALPAAFLVGAATCTPEVDELAQGAELVSETKLFGQSTILEMPQEGAAWELEKHEGPREVRAPPLLETWFENHNAVWLKYLLVLNLVE